MPLDAQVERFLASQGANAAPASLSERREQRKAQSTMTVDDHVVDGPRGPIPIRVYTPPEPKPLPVLVYYHGGGWVTGDLEGSDFQCRLLSRWAGCIVVHVNYRHAPENRFPAALDDAYAGTCWVEDNAGTIGADVNRMSVGGDSAGGNLAASVALLARDRGTPRLMLQYLAYPITDGSMSLPSYTQNATGYGLTAESMAWFWDQYVPDRSERSNPLASPLNAPELGGLPQAIVLTAEFDPLRDEGEAYAKRLMDAGVAVEARRYDGLVHGFLGQTAVVNAAKVAMADLTNALRRAFSQVPASRESNRSPVS